MGNVYSDFNSKYCNARSQSFDCGSKNVFAARMIAISSQVRNSCFLLGRLKVGFLTNDLGIEEECFWKISIMYVLVEEPSRFIVEILIREDTENILI